MPMSVHNHVAIMITMAVTAITTTTTTTTGVADRAEWQLRRNLQRASRRLRLQPARTALRLATRRRHVC